MCTEAREFLSRRGLEYDSHRVEHAPMDREATVDVARRARHLLIKSGGDVVRVDVEGGPLDDARAARYLVHEDGFMRVPVLVVGDLIVRGFTDALYTEALGARTPAP
jgi:arsenate reductase-like glutaredoxin family protein